MKNSIKIFLVIAIMAIGFGAKAQGTGTSADPFKVKLNSTRVFSIVGDAASTYAWTVKTSDVTTAEFEMLNQATSSLTVKWLAVGTYKITARETSANGCTDDGANLKEFYVEVEANTFAVAVKWNENALDPNDTKAPKLTATDCAIVTVVGGVLNFDNVISFEVSQTGGQFSVASNNWSFDCEYQISENGIDWSAPSSADIIGNKLVSNGSVSTLTITKAIALKTTTNGDFLLKIKIKDAIDGYFTPSTTTPEVTATYRRLEATGEITVN